MKINFNSSGGFEFISEDGRDELWLKEFIKTIYVSHKCQIDNFFSVDLADINNDPSGYRGEISIILQNGSLSDFHHLAGEKIGQTT